MQTVLLVMHLLIAVSLVGVVMLQKSEGGGLGLGAGGGMSGFMTGRSTANLLTRTTAILFAALMISSIVLTVIAARQHADHGSILDRIQAAPLPLQTAPTVPLTGSAAPAGSAPANTNSPTATPAAPKAPSVPLAK